LIIDIKQDNSSVIVNKNGDDAPKGTHTHDRDAIKIVADDIFLRLKARSASALLPTRSVLLFMIKKLLLSSPAFQAVVGVSGSPQAAFHLPAVMKILPFRQWTQISKSRSRGSEVPDGTSFSSPQVGDRDYRNIAVGCVGLTVQAVCIGNTRP
jgi:hypothetical protein